MIVAVGTDLVEVARVGRAVGDPRTGGRFRARVFTPAETAYCEAQRSPAQSFAARFAAKEAVMKALGQGFGDGVGWREIEVVRGDGQPALVVTGRAAMRATALRITRWHLSLSHTATHALAFVVAETDGETPAR